MLTGDSYVTIGEAIGDNADGSCCDIARLFLGKPRDDVSSNETSYDVDWDFHGKTFMR